MWLVVVRDGRASVKPAVRLDEPSSRNLGDPRTAMLAAAWFIPAQPAPVTGE